MAEVFERGQREGTIRDDQPAEALYFAWAALAFSWNGFFDAKPQAMADTIMGVLFPPA
jgi:hypothetical protein